VVVKVTMVVVSFCVFSNQMVTCVLVLMIWFLQLMRNRVKYQVKMRNINFRDKCVVFTRGVMIARTYISSHGHNNSCNRWFNAIVSVVYQIANTRSLLMYLFIL